MDSEALTKIQAMVLIAIIAVATMSGVAVYYLWSGKSPIGETIKIGLCTDLDSSGGQTNYRDAVMAVEHVNAEGGVLGMKFELVAEDDDSLTAPFDIAVATNALTKLIVVDNADYIFAGGAFTSVYQEIAADHKKIMFDIADMLDQDTQKVLDNYDRYKYYFRIGAPNYTSALDGVADNLAALRDYTGFNKVALASNPVWGAEGISGFEAEISDLGFEIVYTADIPFEQVDLSSYFAQAEAADAEIIFPLMILGTQAIPFINEYHSRQSPMILCGNVPGALAVDFWVTTEGKCECTSIIGYPTIVGYPLTNKTVQYREDYIERWGADQALAGAAVYDAVRYILTDAIRRAGTTETEAVIEALESTDMETSLVRRFVFTSSHDIMVGEAGPNRPGEDYFLVCMFQWQDLKQVPVYPKKIMEEAGATYTFPDWPGPWNE